MNPLSEEMLSLMLNAEVYHDCGQRGGEGSGCGSVFGVICRAGNLDTMIYWMGVEPSLSV